MPHLRDHKAVTNTLDGNDLNRRVLLEIITELGNINVKIAAIEKGIAAPKKVQNITTLNNLVPVFV